MIVLLYSSLGGKAETPSFFKKRKKEIFRGGVMMYGCMQQTFIWFIQVYWESNYGKMLTTQHIAYRW